MIDSSVLVEFSKGTRKKLLLSIIDNPDNEYFINETVVSEYLYYYLILKGGAAPTSLKSSEKIKEIINQSTDYMLLRNFLFLPATDLMAKYNLLPNDAIILATCKIHNITQLASHDKDFEEACKAEGITLLTE
jgi:predicted nucleic acid-binding protein